MTSHQIPAQAVVFKIFPLQEKKKSKKRAEYQFGSLKKKPFAMYIPGILPWAVSLFPPSLNIYVKRDIARLTGLFLCS